MRHSFKAAPPADHTANNSSKNLVNCEASHIHRPDSKLQNGKAPANNRRANGDAHGHVNGYCAPASEGKRPWRSITEEALKKLQGAAGVEMHASAGGPVAPVSVSGLSRSASFTSLDSQANLEICSKGVSSRNCLSNTHSGDL